MARSRNKYSRARMRARVRRPKRRGGARWFYAAIAVIAIGGLTGIALSVGGSDVHPLIMNSAGEGDHWHSAFGVNVCGEWLSDPAEFTTRHDEPGVYAGLHSHGDGFIHVEAAASSEAGNNATLGRFLEYGGWFVSGTSLRMWEGPPADPSKLEWNNGDTCPAGSPMAGRKGVVKWSIDCKARTGDPNAYKLEDLQVIALAFLPKSEAIGVPPNASAAPVGETGGALGNLSVKSCSTAGPGGATSGTTTPSTLATTTTAPATP